EAEVDDCLDGFVGAISGNAKCAATKMNAVGKKTKAKMLCHRKAALTGAGVSPSCLSTAEATFTTAISRADTFGTCTGTATGLETLVDDCVTNLADGTTECILARDTAPTATVNPNGCAVLSRDTSSCAAARVAAGLTGYWQKFSCRVTLSATAGGVTAQSD